MKKGNYLSVRGVLSYCVIDYIFYRPQTAMEVLEHHVVAETYASDHRPVVAVLGLL
ncbi:hypothetical protein [Parapedobacter composti]|uniref:hypothetical protein n=1 Tax=Parapedobacter composti TaxID=623281 RepID=UPI001B8D94CA|nr:hypothetical protein [Parapedobacter composti]